MIVILTWAVSGGSPEDEHGWQRTTHSVAARTSRQPSRAARPVAGRTAGRARNSSRGR